MCFLDSSALAGTKAHEARWMSDKHAVPVSEPTDVCHMHVIMCLFAGR